VLIAIYFGSSISTFKPGGKRTRLDGPVYLWRKQRGERRRGHLLLLYLAYAAL
jgi:hypothetical protein